MPEAGFWKPGTLDTAEPSVTATVTPADCSSGRIVLSRDGVLHRINFAARLQAFLDIELDRPVPPCPLHRVGLVPFRVGELVHWRCEAGDFQCRVGDCEAALWPPGPDEDPDRIAPMLSRRFSHRRLTGIDSFSVERRDGRWVAKIKLRPDADRSAISRAADPILVEVERVQGVRTITVQRSATDTERSVRPRSGHEPARSVVWVGLRQRDPSKPRPACIATETARCPGSRRPWASARPFRKRRRVL
jgi:hypothetical protein